MRKVGHNEQDQKIGIALGAGMSVEKAAEFVGIAPNTLRAHLDTNGTYILAVKAETETALALTASKKVQDVVKPAEDRIKSFFDRSFRLSERALAEAERQADEAEKGGADNKVDLKALMAIHKDFTVWAAKFSASEAPKRMEMTGSVEQVHTLSGDVMDRLTGFMTRHQNLLPAGEPRVIDAVVVESTP